MIRVAILAGITCALLFLGVSSASASGSANAGGGWSVSSSNCPPNGNSCQIRDTKVDITRSNTSWLEPTGNSDYEWIGVGSLTGDCATRYGCIVQAGYARFAPGNGPAGCGALGTGSAVKVLYYELDYLGNESCYISDFSVGPNEDHSLEIFTYGTGTNADWQTWLDGAHKHTYNGPLGFGASPTLDEIVAEFSCLSCMGPSTYMGAWWGLKTSDSLYPWMAGPLNSPANVTSTFTGLIDQEGCGSGSNSSWNIDDVQVSSGWLINWSNGGTSC